MSWEGSRRRLSKASAAMTETRATKAYDAAVKHAQAELQAQKVSLLRAAEEEKRADMAAARCEWEIERSTELAELQRVASADKAAALVTSARIHLSTHLSTPLHVSNHPSTHANPTLSSSPSPPPTHLHTSRPSTPASAPWLFLAMAARRDMRRHSITCASPLRSRSATCLLTCLLTYFLLTY